MIIDTHSHCYWDSLLPRIDEIIDAMNQNHVTHAVQIGCDRETSEKALALAKRYPGTFFATVGHHPETAQHMLLHPEWIEWADAYITSNRDVIVAVGECGLDFHYLDGTDDGILSIDLENLSSRANEQIENQKSWWLAQWNLAQKHNLPLVIHTRDARDATVRFMLENNINRCVMHCYSEDLDMARTLLDFSDEIYFSFSGILTYKKSDTLREVARNIPLDRILVETDAPFLAPQAVRGTVNEPANTRYTLEKLIEIRDESTDEIESRVYENSLRFYGIRI